MSFAPIWRRCDPRKGKNKAASIRARLLALAQSKSEDYQRVLGRFAIERFLYRLGRIAISYPDFEYAIIQATEHFRERKMCLAPR
jgi:hypothetical protein